MKDGETNHSHDRWNSFTGRSTVSIEKAAELLGVSINTIVTLRNKGTLKTAALNKQLITVASLKAYDLKRVSRKQSRRTEESKPQLKVVNQ
ncbi:MAG TPA: helix-turn-helix domain-containing protein [Ktedonobacteraceae bacterium]|nr:helix-turn-helix domain-containing protein [Ktedonobacteraceae bacterium]